MKIQDFKVQVNGNQTPWRIFVPDGGKEDWAVLWLQGFGSTVEGHTEGIARLADATGTTFAVLDYAGHGNNPINLDDATRAQQFAEVLAVYDELVEQGYNKIVAIGGSFGGYMAALLAGERSLQTVVLRAPAIYNDAEFNLSYSKTVSSRSENEPDPWRISVTSNTQSVALDNIRDFVGSTYIMEHELDETVSKNVPQAYVAVAQNPNYILIEGCKHSPKFMSNPEKYFEIIERWLTTIILNTQRNAQKD